MDQNADALSRRPCFDSNCIHRQRKEEREFCPNGQGSRAHDTLSVEIPNHVVRELRSGSSIPGERKLEEGANNLLEDHQWTPLQLRTNQMTDRTISHILKWKETDKRREWASIAHLDSVTKAYWAQWESFFLKEGVLYHRWESREPGKET